MASLCPRSVVATLFALSLSGCDGSKPDSDTALVDAAFIGMDSDSGPQAIQLHPLIEPRVPKAVAGEGQWKYVERAKADFDGDGAEETAVLITDVTLDARGEPLWEDGHRWQVYIEESDSTRRHLYARFLPNGKLEASVGVPEPGQAATIILRESTPEGIRAYEISSAGFKAIQSATQGPPKGKPFIRSR